MAFWFAPSPVISLQFVRRALCVVTALYFLSAWGDVETWFQRGAPASSSNLATFFRTAELTDDARWMVSPLFVWDSIFADSALGESALVYRLYLLVGVVLALLVSVSDQWRRFNLPATVLRLLSSFWPSLLLWIWMVGWANRVVLLAGIVEPVLSVSLAALVVAPIIGSSAAENASNVQWSWRTTVSRRLLAVQATLIALMTTATMLASPTWWNGTGAYALIAPAEDRFFDVRGTFFETSWVYEMTTTAIVWTLPIGVFLAWRNGSRSFGIGLIVAWCVVVGFLSANVLYAATLGIIATTIGGAPTIGDGDPVQASAQDF
jgi:hypothetical protein